MQILISPLDVELSPIPFCLQCLLLVALVLAVSFTKEKTLEWEQDQAQLLQEIVLSLSCQYHYIHHKN